MILDLLREALGWLLIGGGGLLFLIGAIGFLRMPDVFTRMHAASVAETAGAGLMLIGMMVMAGLSLVTAKLALLLAFLWFSGPVATHAIARAALQAGVKPHLGETAGAGQSEPHASNGQAARGEGGPSTS